VEAFASAKPVITCTDSGGPLEFVRHRQNGLVVAPEPAALAQACVEVTADAALAERLGSQGQRDIAALTWPNTVKKLVLA
jgi:glycosyltransferase involved in cell wall biosynthesis